MIMSFRGALCSAVVAATLDEPTQLMQSSLVSVDAHGHVEEVLDVQTNDNEEFVVQTNGNEEQGNACTVYFYTQSNCMFMAGTTGGDAKKFGRGTKSFRQFRSSGSRGDACRVESYAGAEFTGAKTEYKAGACVKTSNGYGASKSFKQFGNEPPPPCKGGNMHPYWQTQFKNAGVDQEEYMNEICYANSQWYYHGKSTKVGMGGYNVNCDTGKFKCAGGSKFGYGINQAKLVKVAIDHGGVYPGAPSLAQTETEFDEENMEPLDGMEFDEENMELLYGMEADTSLVVEDGFPAPGPCEMGYGHYPGQLGGSQSCKETTVGGPYCVVSKRIMGTLCGEYDWCTGYAVTSNAGWNNANPSSGMLLSGGLSGNGGWSSCKKMCEFGYRYRAAYSGRSPPCAETTVGGYCIVPKSQMATTCKRYGWCKGYAVTSSGAWNAGNPDSGMLLSGALTSNNDWYTCEKI